MRHWQRFLERSLLFDSDGGGGSSAAGGDGGDGGSGRDVPLDTDVLVAKYGDARAALAKVVSKLDSVEADNAKYRKQIRDLKEKVPGEDERVLSAEEQQALRERGLLTEEGEIDVKPFDEKAKRAEAADALEHKEQLREVAEVEGIEGFDAFAELAADDAFEIQEEDGEKYAVVTLEEDGAEKTVRVAEHPKYGREGTFAPAVYGGGSEKKETSRGPTFPKQTPAAANKKTGDDDPVGAFLKKANQRRAGQNASSDEE